MIATFQLCFEDDGCLNLSLNGDKGNYILKENEPALISLYHKSKSTGVTWSHGRNRITFLEPKLHIFGLPSPKMDKVVIVYSSGHSIFNKSRNAAIYNPDGSLSVHLDIPILISKYSKEYGKKASESDVWYDHISWHKLENSEIVMKVRIGFNRDWYEERVLDTETGELKELIECGRF